MGNKRNVKIKTNTKTKTKKLTKNVEQLAVEDCLGGFTTNNNNNNNKNKNNGSSSSSSLCAACFWSTDVVSLISLPETLATTKTLTTTIINITKKEHLK